MRFCVDDVAAQRNCSGLAHRNDTSEAVGTAIIMMGTPMCGGQPMGFGSMSHRGSMGHAFQHWLFY